MEVISSVNLIRYDTSLLKEIFSGEDRIQLKIDSKAEFDSLLKSDKADLIYDNHEKIMSIRGPIRSSLGGSIFEDTALIVSCLEDNFNVSLQYITTLPLGDGKHITELSEFFQDAISIFASTLPFATDSQFRTPYGISEYIKGIYCDGPGYDKMAYMGISYNVFELNRIWLEAEICYAMLDLIDEIHLWTEARHVNSSNWVEILNCLAQMKAMGNNSYVTFDIGDLTLINWRTFKKLVQGV